MLHLKIVSFTAQGDALGDVLVQKMPQVQAERYARGTDASLQHTKLSRFAQQAMYDCHAVIWIGAAGIAVRMVAPYLRSKTEDPAVIVMDEGGNFVIPLLSGHLGGANAIAKELADAIGAQLVLTTATDVRQVFAVDSWAASQGLAVWNPAKIRYVASALLRGEAVGMQADLFVQGALPHGVQQGTAACGFVISSYVHQNPFAHTLHLIPKNIVLGLGCRKGKTADEIDAFITQTLMQYGLCAQAIESIATIDCKQHEAGILEVARRRGLALHIFTAAQLQQVEGSFSSSSFVAHTVGVDNVCERAAVAASAGTLLHGKVACNGITIALAQKAVEVSF